MDKTFFESYEQRKADFAQRTKAGDEVRAEFVLHNGRHFIVDTVVAVSDAYLQIDARDVADDTVPLSIVLPYHQISFVQFVKPRPRMRHAGFAP